MSQTALITDEQMPLDLGSLVSLSINICEPLPALVAGADERYFVLQTAGRLPCKVGDRAVIGWSIGGELHELRTRVVRPYGLASELTVSRHGIITRTGDRRGVARFVLVAGGSLLVTASARSSASRTTSRSTASGCCWKARRRRSARAAASRCGCVGVLLPRATVRVVHTSETRQEGVARVGLAFDDPARVAGATGRLLALLDVGADERAGVRAFEAARNPASHGTTASQ